MSDEAARAAQHVLDLEFTLKETEEARDNLRSMLESIKHDNARLEQRLDKLLEERDFYKERVVNIEARFDDAATIILKVLDQRITRPPPVPVDTDQIEHAAQEPKAEPVSDFAPGPRP